MSEALRQVVWKCDRCGGDAQAIFGIFPSCKCGSTSFKAAQPPAPTAQPASSDADRLLHEVFALCEDTEDKMAERDGQFERGRAFEAKGIRRAIGTWFQDTFCGRSFMGEAAQPVQQPSAEFDHSIGADRFTVRRGSFWWHVRIGGSTSNVGKFHTKLAAEDMALKMLTAYRDGAFEQYQAARAHAAPAQRQPLTAEAVFASKDFMSMNGLYWGLGIETLMQIVRVTERECAAAWGVTLAQKGEKL